MINNIQIKDIPKMHVDDAYQKIADLLSRHSHYKGGEFAQRCRDPRNAEAHKENWGPFLARRLTNSAEQVDRTSVLTAEETQQAMEFFQAALFLMDDLGFFRRSESLDPTLEVSISERPRTDFQAPAPTSAGLDL